MEEEEDNNFPEENIPQDDDDDPDDYQQYVFGNRSKTLKDPGENIEMKKFDTPKDPELEWDNYDIETILSTIEDPELLNRTRTELSKLDGKQLPVDKKIKNSLVKEIHTSLHDELDVSQWDDLIITEEKKKFLWEQKIKNLNSVLESKDIFLDYKNKKLYEYIEKKSK